MSKEGDEKRDDLILLRAEKFREAMAALMACGFTDDDIGVHCLINDLDRLTRNYELAAQRVETKRKRAKKR